MPSVRSHPTLAVFCSGQGSNFQAILSALRKGRLKARIRVLVTDRTDAKALDRAKRAGIPTLVLEPKIFTSRKAYERRLLKELKPYNIDFICLAGFMRIFTPVFIKPFANRILNVHPALLPAFPGAHGIRDALNWGAKITGVTVHLVDEQVDHGPILLQEAVVIRPKETHESLLARIHKVEHRLYPEAIRKVLTKRMHIRGRRVQFI